MAGFFKRNNDPEVFNDDVFEDKSDSVESEIDDVVSPDDVVGDTQSVDTSSNNIDEGNRDIPHSPTFEETESLVRERIQWFRKWTDDVPTFTHSFHVRQLLKENWFNETVQMAGLLHDIVEDWNTSLNDLKDMWYSEEIVHLVDLATHDSSIKDKFERWLKMMNRLDNECNRDAWAIKLADICDNVNDCHTMPDQEKKKRFLFEKCPFFVDQWNKRFWWTEFYLLFLKRYHIQLMRAASIERKRTAWRIIWAVIWLIFISWAAIWAFWWYEWDVLFMKLWLGIVIVCWILMWILHILCFRLDDKFRKWFFSID